MTVYRDSVGRRYERIGEFAVYLDPEVTQCSCKGGYVEMSDGGASFKVRPCEICRPDEYGRWQQIWGAHGAHTAALNGHRNDDEPTVETSWSPVDLGPILDGGSIDVGPALLRRRDGHGLIYPGKLHAFNGEPEGGKSWLGQYLCKEQLDAGHSVLYVDFEDGPDGVVSRLLALGANRDGIRERFNYLRPDEPLEPADRIGPRRLGFEELILDTKPTVGIVDGVTESMVLHGLSLKDNDDIAAWIARLPRVITRLGVACVLIDHVTKDREGRGRWAIGGQHKLAGIDGAAYSVEVIRPFGRGLTGIARLEVTKDRPGFVRGAARAGKRAGEFHLEANLDGTEVKAELRGPDDNPESTFRPTALMEKCSRYIESHPDLSTNSIKSAVGGKGEFLTLALELLVSEGYVATKQDGRRRLHASIKAFRDDEDER